MKKINIRYLPKYEEALAFWEWLTELYNTGKIKRRDYIWFCIAIFYGRRLSEIMLLKPEDFDFENNIIWFRQLKSRKKDDVRPVHIISRIKRLLEDYVGFVKRVGYERLFECTGRNMRYVCYKYTEMFFSRRLCPHEFRHLVSTYITREVGLARAKDFLGHQSVQTTQRYTHLTPEDIKKKMPKHLQ